MKKKWVIIASAVMMTAYAGFCMGSEASVELGKQLFNDPALGGSTNGKSCNSCHADGKGLEKAGTSANLAGTINMCIEKALKGQGLDTQSKEMEALEMYIKTFQK